MIRRLGTGLGVGLVLVVAYLALWPVRVDPLAWQAPDDEGFTRRFVPTGTLADVTRWELPDGHGPEDVAVGPDGRVWAGLADGRLVRWEPDGTGPETIVSTGGRPLGLKHAPDGRLIVADATRGLLRVDGNGNVEVLCTEVDGRPLVFTDDLDVADDEVVWFSDASDRFGQPEWKLDMFESRANGRLVSYDLKTGVATTRLDDLYFANGVALSADGTFVLVNETSRYRVRRLWIRGPLAGTTDVLVDNLPGFPDGIARGEDGLFWIALGSPRNALLDQLDEEPWLRTVLARLPRFAQPAPVRHPVVVAVDGQGRIRHTLSDPDGVAYAVPTNVVVSGGWLWLGSLQETAIARKPWGVSPPGR